MDLGTRLPREAPLGNDTRPFQTATSSHSTGEIMLTFSMRS